MKYERNLSMEKTFEMKKNDSAFLPQECKSVIIGLGWTCPGSIDLDASVVGLKENKKESFIVNYGNKIGPGVTHRGDNTTGDGAGDDERIRIDLDQVSDKTSELYVTINIYTGNTKFNKVKDSYVRLCVADASSKFGAGHELADYPLDGNLPCRGIVFCRLKRHGPKWSFDALAWGCEGGTVKDEDCMDVIKGKRDPIAL